MAGRILSATAAPNRFHSVRSRASCTHDDKAYNVSRHQFLDVHLGINEVWFLVARFFGCRDMLYDDDQDRDETRGEVAPDEILQCEKQLVPATPDGGAT